ncbi:hypothetical protein KC851_00545 [Candidatus Kaiserbacteria bacterium]|nr:hypothetical protein [Candidatus Kaiserbacteria bacterium]
MWANLWDTEMETMNDYLLVCLMAAWTCMLAYQFDKQVAEDLILYIGDNITGSQFLSRNRFFVISFPLLILSAIIMD